MPVELAVMRLQHPSVCSFDVCPAALLSEIRLAKNNLIECVNPCPFFVELRARHLSRALVPAVIIVDGKVHSCR